MVFSAEEERLMLSMGADEVYVIQELKLDTLDLGLPKTRGFLARMPFLVTLSIAQGAIAGAILEDVMRTFKHLQHLRFDLTRSCSRETLVLLIESSGLKSFRGKGRTVLAHDLVDSAEWSCVGLEELDIEIHLQALKNLWIFDPSWFKAAIDEAVITAEQQEGEMAQIRQRLQQLGHEPTSNEIEALEKRHMSHVLERKVFQRLGRLTQLREITFGKPSDPEPKTTCQYIDTPEYSLASGFAELGGLVHLREITIHKATHRVMDAEEKWVKGQWSMKKSVSSGTRRFKKVIM
ncbi:hypothetical protein BGZ89_009844 [Linnemannia elongata]|nr:hypothetical protein BGZ89_009844 [Linnemannia elongata]